MKSNPLLKWLLIPMALVLVLVGIKLFLRRPRRQPAGAGRRRQSAHARGDEGAGHRRATRRAIPSPRWWPRSNSCATSCRPRSPTTSQKAENERLRAREGAIDQRIQTARWTASAAACNRTTNPGGQRPPADPGPAAGLQRRPRWRTSGRAARPILPVGWAWRTATARLRHRRQRPRQDGGTRWVEPDDAKPSAGTAAPAG